MRYQILIVDDDLDFAKDLSLFLKSEKRDFILAYSIKEAIKILKDNEIHLVLLDEQLPDMSGLDLLEKISKEYSDLITIMITSSDKVSNVVKAIRLGAYNYIVKPYEMENLEIVVNNALEKVELQNKLKNLEDGVISLEKPVFIGTSNINNELKSKIEKLKGHPFSSILITGETGTGKGNIAKYIHWQYDKDMSKFIHISCADIQPNLLETELFGYEKGAFTDAKASKKGLFEIADGGTLFLDEIDSMPINVQSKLLHFLDNKRIRKVGGTKEINTNVRLIAASNANLENLVNEKKFRKDLYFRLNMIKFHLLPLKEKSEDIKELSEYFISFYNKHFGKRINKITDKAIEKLRKHDWPGNIRELRNTIENAMIFCDNNILTEDDFMIIKSSLLGGGGIGKSKFYFPNSITELIPLKNLNHIYVEHVLNMFDGNKSKASKTLNIAFNTLATMINSSTSK